MSDLHRQFNASFDSVIAAVSAALAEEGFGIVSDLDMKEIFKKKLGEDFGSYRILGACNPSYAKRALTADPAVGLLLPCNVVVHEANGAIHVRAFDPMEMAHVPGEVKEVAKEVRARLEAFLARVRPI
jgi:uncharacterized protein (DUF302 family)